MNDLQVQSQSPPYFWTHKSKISSFYTIGHSVNSPWPNRKKLVLPESTTAIMMTLFPVFKATNGFGLRSGGERWIGGVENNQGKSLRISVGCTFWEDISVVGGWMGFNAALVIGAPGSWRRWRGGGSGISGRTSNRSVSSWSVGIGVVRALNQPSERIS